MTTDAEPVLVPKTNANDEEVLILAWRAASGSRVLKGDVLAEVESTKAVFDIAAEEDGYLFISAAVGQRLPVGSLIAWIAKRPDFVPPAAAAPVAAETGVRFTMKAEKLARAHGLSLSSFVGPVVREEEVVARLGQQARAPIAPHRRLSLSPHKRGEVRRLQQSAGIYSSATRPIPLAPIQQRLAAQPERSHTLGEWVVWACGQTLLSHGSFNAFYEQDALNLYGTVHVAYGIRAADGPLLAPVARAVEALTPAQVSDAIKELMLRYHRQELRREDLQGATFTVSDMAGTGVTHFQPLISPGQSAVLGICAPGPTGDFFNLVLGFDHRAADGLEAAALLAALETVLCGEPVPSPSG